MAVKKSAKKPITARHRIRLKPELLRKLVDFELLVPVAAEISASAR
jgi:hypothetical protein